MAEPQVVFGAGHVHITQVKDALGNKITPPQVIAAPAVQNVAADFGKADVKTLHGQKEFAIHAAQGKKSTEVSFECGELYLKMLNALYFGQSVESGSLAIRRDTAGTLVPEYYERSVKITAARKSFQINNLVSVTGVLINGVAAAAYTGSEAVPTGQYKVSNGMFSFAAANANKYTTITYVAVGGVTVSSQLKIPETLSFNSHDFTAQLTLTASLAFSREAYNIEGATPAVGSYQMDKGIYIYNGAETRTNLVITHTTDGQRVVSTIAALPTSAVGVIIDPPGSSVYVSTVSVRHTKSNGGMTGVALGDELTAGSGTPTTGQYVVTPSGQTAIYSFAVADVGETVKITYTTDFEYMVMTPPNAGEFVADKGVRNADGMPLTRVALTSPVSLLHNQYAVSNAGAYYFDSSNAGDRLFIDYEYSSSAGATLVIANNDMGSTPIVSLDISGTAEGQEWLIKYPRAIPKAFGFATKMDDFGTYKITYDVLAERMSGKVGTVCMTA